MILGDFNLPARRKYFKDLLGPALGYEPSVDPDVYVSMLSNVDDLSDLDFSSSATGAAKAEKRGKKRTKETDKLYDNIFLSPPLRGSADQTGGDVLRGAVVNLINMVPGAMPKEWNLGVQYREKLELELKIKVARRSMSDHLPVWCDLRVVPCRKRQQ